MKKLSDPQLFKAIKHFLTEYLPSVKSKSENTIQAYRITINLYIDYLIASGIAINKITCNDFKAKKLLTFLEWLITNRQNSIATRNLRLSQMRQFCNYLYTIKLLDISDLSDIQSISKIKAPVDNELIFLSLEQTKALLSQPNEHNRFGLRDKFFLSLLYDSGCRDQEILDLKLKDFVIKTNGAELHIVGKGRKFRVTPISQAVVLLYKEYCSVYHENPLPDDYLFYTKRNGSIGKMSCDNVARFMTKYEAELKVKIPSTPHLHPHLLRHTRAMHLYTAGMPLALVSEWLGHSQMETTTIYARATIEMKRAAVEKLSSENNDLIPVQVFEYADNDAMIKKLYCLK